MYVETIPILIYFVLLTEVLFFFSRKCVWYNLDSSTAGSEISQQCTHSFPIYKLFIFIQVIDLCGNYHYFYLFRVMRQSPAVFPENVLGTIWIRTRQAQKLAVSVRIFDLFMNRTSQISAISGWGRCLLCLPGISLSVCAHQTRNLAAEFRRQAAVVSLNELQNDNKRDVFNLFAFSSEVV